MREGGIADRNPAHRAMEMLEEKLAHRRRAFRKALDQPFDGFIAQPAQEARFPVIQRALRIGAIEHRVELAVRDRSDCADSRCSELLDRLDGGLGSLAWPEMANHHGGE